MKNLLIKPESLDEALIKNTQLEAMFLSVCTDAQMKKFTELVSKGLAGTATAYASHKVFKVFKYWRDAFIKQGGDLEYLNEMLWRKK